MTNTDWKQAGRFFCLGVGCAGAAGLAYEAYKRVRKTPNGGTS